MVGAMAGRNRGLFVVFEGLDRSGKTSQSTRLAKAMQAFKMNFPDRQNLTGGMINDYLKNSNDLSDECIHLLFSANRWEEKKNILQKINSGESVVCDRYVYSGISYSSAKGLDYSWCRAPDVGLPRPDVVVFLNLSSEEAEKRGGYGEERYEKKEFQKKVAQQFEKFSGDDNWLVVNADQDPEAVYTEILQGLKNRGLWSDDGPVLPSTALPKLWVEQ